MDWRIDGCLICLRPTTTTPHGRGDEEAQYALAARFCPPPFKKRERCRKCHRAFGVTRYRHHCRHCGESFCQVRLIWQARKQA